MTFPSQVPKLGGTTRACIVIFFFFSSLVHPKEMLNIGRQPLYLGLLALLQLVGLALFCKGFFPYKIYLSGHATPDDMPTFLKDLHNEPEFDRLVFVVIDALRK